MRGLQTRLETARLRLRPFRREDLPALEELYGDEEVMQFSITGPIRGERVAVLLQRHRDVLEREGFGFFAVEERGTPGMVGMVGLVRQELDGRGEVELGYRLLRRARGRGLATEAARAVCRQAFGELGLEHLIALIEPANTASIRLAERLGFRLEGGRPFHGRFVEVYGCARGELREPISGSPAGR